MIIFSEYTGFCHMISFYINCFESSTFRAVSDNKSESLKFVTIRLCNVSVINVYNRFLRSPFTDSSKIRFKSCGGSAVVYSRACENRRMWIKARKLKDENILK